jgi:cytidylate kinase
VAPLRRADDALELDTTGMTFDEGVAWILDRARAVFGR